MCLAEPPLVALRPIEWEIKINVLTDVHSANKAVTWPSLLLLKKVTLSRGGYGVHSLLTELLRPRLIWHQLGWTLQK